MTRNAVDLQDLSCASGDELDRLDPATLDDSRLVGNLHVGWPACRDDARTGAAGRPRLSKQPPARRPGVARSDPAVVSPLVRLAVSRRWRLQGGLELAQGSEIV